MELTKFINNVKLANNNGPIALMKLMRNIISNPAKVKKMLGKHYKLGVNIILRSDSLTIINFVCNYNIYFPPHNHKMDAIIGLYEGREDNIIWERHAKKISAKNAISLEVGDVVHFDRTTIHSVINSLNTRCASLHIYQGDFFSPIVHKSMWDIETLKIKPYNTDELIQALEKSEQTGVILTNK